MEFRLARASETDAVAALYEAAKREPFSVWNAEYPNRSDAVLDLENGSLYVLADGDCVIGALSVVSDNECDGLPCWRVTGEGVRELARVVIGREHHGNGYAARMVEAVCAILRARGDRAVHISVAKCNLPARKTYPRVGFVEVGEAPLFGDDYILMEKLLSVDTDRSDPTLYK